MKKIIMKDGIKVPPISLWKYDPKKSNVRVDGKLFICDFKNIFIGEELDPYAKFMNNKDSYNKQLDKIVRYINYFISEYDKENELALGYIKLKYAIDNEKLFAISQDPTDEEINTKINAFIEYLYLILFDEDSHIKENIIRLIDDNYVDDIEANTSRKSKRDYLESLEFTNEHNKLLLSISFAMKLISPVMYHYLYINTIKLTGTSDYVYMFFRPLFDEVFFDGKINIFNKLFVYVKQIVLEAEQSNRPIFNKREIFGVDVYALIRRFVKKIIISDSMIKYDIPEKWNPKTKRYTANIPGFNKTLLKCQIDYFLKVQYEKNLSEVDTARNSDGLSGADKMEMNIRKIDEGKMVLNRLNAEITARQLKYIIDIPVSDEEVEYMKDNFKPSKLQIRLINTFFAHYLGNYRDTFLIVRNDFYYLALLLKKKLLIENGYMDEDAYKVCNGIILPYVLTGNLVGKLNSRMIRNSKYMATLEDDLSYQRLKEEYSLMLEIRPDELKSIISSFVNSQFSYVTPEDKSLTGQNIIYDEHQIGSELITFMYHMGKHKY